MVQNLFVGNYNCVADNLFGPFAEVRCFSYFRKRTVLNLEF